MDFAKYNLEPQLVATLAKHGYLTMTEVQEKVIPLALSGESLIVKSATGSGKTHSFLIPLLARLNKFDGIQAIILAPTRELARQLYNFSVELNKDYRQIDILLLAGGIEKSRSKDRLVNKPQLIIATPGRFKDLLVSEDVTSLKSVHTLILDEGDMLLDAGFYNDIVNIIEEVSPLTIQLFSATIPQKLVSLISKKTGVKSILSLDKHEKTSYDVTHHLIDVHHQDRQKVTLDFIKAYNPYLILVFCSTNKEVMSLYDYLSATGLKVGILTGELEVRKRKAMFRRVQNNEFSVIVASDIAARGIDILDVSHVLSVSFPFDLEFYFHRAGRTGRNYAKGEAFTLYDHDDLKTVAKLEKEGVKFTTLLYRSGEFVNAPKPKKSLKEATVSEKALEEKIKKAVAVTRKKKVEPRYKKKVKEEISRVKRRHKRQEIKQAIKEKHKASRRGD